MSKSLNITLIMDKAWIPAEDPDLSNDDLTPLTERHVAHSLRALGHNVRVVGVGDSVQDIVAALAQDTPDLVFNLVEQFRDDRRLDANVTALLELFGIPFTGAGSAGLMLCRDKGLCKQILNLHKIHVPAFVAYEPGERVYVPKHLNYPLIVKPQFEDASDGIAKRSLVKNETELADRVRLVHEQWRQIAIAEEYIEGRELYVALVGNKRLTVFPIRELHFGDSGDDAPCIATGRVKTDPEYRDKWNIEYRFAQLPAALSSEVARVCKRMYRLLQLRGYGRVDLRVTAEGKIKVLEVNANPDIAYGEDFAESAEKGGVKYEQLISRIVRLALRWHHHGR